MENTNSNKLLIFYVNNHSTIKIMYCMYNNNNAVKIENGANQGATYLVGIQSSLNVKSQGGLLLLTVISMT